MVTPIRIAGYRAVAVRIAAQGAPLNTARIGEIRAAISTGCYPVDPQRIARAMLAIDDVGGDR